jgi:hypothetical protein
VLFCSDIEYAGFVLIFKSDLLFVKKASAVLWLFVFHFLKHFLLERICVSAVRYVLVNFYPVTTFVCKL